MKATREYKASLDKLLAVYESRVVQATSKLEVARKLYAEGLTGKASLDLAERELESLKSKVQETKRDIATADAKIADILAGTGAADSRPPTSPNRVPQSTGKCSLPLEQSPTVRGMKLGQTVSDVQKLFEDDPGAGIYVETNRGLGDPDALRVRSQRLYARNFPRVESLKGIDTLELKYLDDKLASFAITYDDSVKWQSTAHFAAAIAEQLHLPTIGWEGRYELKLMCDGFSVVTSSSETSSLTIERSDLNEEIVKRRSALEQKKRVEFKP